MSIGSHGACEITLVHMELRMTSVGRVVGVAQRYDLGARGLETTHRMVGTHEGQPTIRFCRRVRLTADSLILWRGTASIRLGHANNLRVENSVTTNYTTVDSTGAIQPTPQTFWATDADLNCGYIRVAKKSGGCSFSCNQYC